MMTNKGIQECNELLNKANRIIKKNQIKYSKLDSNQKREAIEGETGAWISDLTDDGIDKIFASLKVKEADKLIDGAVCACVQGGLNEYNIDDYINSPGLRWTVRDSLRNISHIKRIDE
jgi:hypothetical protein